MKFHLKHADQSSYQLFTGHDRLPPTTNRGGTHQKSPDHGEESPAVRVVAGAACIAAWVGRCVTICHTNREQVVPVEGFGLRNADFPPIALKRNSDKQADSWMMDRF